MSDYYKGKRTYGLYVPNSQQPFKLSRYRLNLFLECPRCFYTDRRLGVDRPPGFPFTLNSAVDHLLKKEFDVHRAEGSAHPLMESYGLKAIPFSHPKMNDWRNTFVGVQFFHKPTNFIVFGAIDDIWINSEKELIVVDYKATAKEGEVSLDADWQIGYKRQMEVYQWLFRQNGFKVSETGYFVYVNGKTDKEAFDAKLEFDVSLLPYKGNDSWVEDALIKAKACLDANIIPQASPDCDYCLYRESVKSVTNTQQPLF